MGISNDITLTEKDRRSKKKYRVKRPDDYVDPPEVLVLQKKYYERWTSAGRHPRTQATMAFALACARRVHEHPEMSNREWVLRMRNIYVSREALKRNPDQWRPNLEKAHEACRKKGRANRLAKEKVTRTPFAFDASAKAGKDLPI